MVSESVIEMVTERLHAWADFHKGQLPANIIYYRDGVSAGHYAKVKKDELTAIRTAYTAVRKTKGLKPQGLNLTAVIVTKRHHTRFYPTSDGETDKIGKDFYLQSHSGIKGTARPTHYFVLENKVPGLTLEALRDLTHDLAYSYVRSMTPVSYVPPTYYADRLCERGRLYVRRFLVGDDLNFRMEVDAARDKLRAQLKVKRKDEFGDDKDGMIGKEQIRKRMDEDTVNKDVKKWVFEKIKEEFNRYGDGGGDVGQGNPWGRELGKTMFWM
ncbi:Piwi domain-containing protein [Pyrenophora tritici-repentis]|nr:Piwi domain-containing protein [Pyrenophora tritici-repentis]